MILEKSSEYAFLSDEMLITSMLVTDVWDQMVWWQVWDVGDKSHHQHQDLGTNIKYQLPTSYSGVLW